MTTADEKELVQRINELEKELKRLRLQQNARNRETLASKQSEVSNAGLPLELDEYIRYGRQMILPQIGLPGQLALKKASVLVVGAGGLGCPVLLYLAAAGIGNLIDSLSRSYLDRKDWHRRLRLCGPFQLTQAGLT